MKLVKISFLTALAATLVMGLTGSAFAFHDGGVANCDGCHTMHNSYIGTQMKGGKASTIAANGLGNAYLLQGSDPSSTCLNCHGTTGAPNGYHVLTTNVSATVLPGQRTPGGDFGWLLLAQPNTSDTIKLATEATNRHGHHIVAADFGLAAETDNAGVAPGSTSNYPAAQLGCNSCHDPHQNVRADGSALPISESGSYAQTPASGTANGVYRLLAGSGYLLENTPTTFTAAAPIAAAPQSYNQSDTTYTGTRVAYGKGMSEWCANCHDKFLENSYVLGSAGYGTSADHKHPAGNSAKLTTVLSDGSIPSNIYNAYVNTGTSNGTQGTSYLSLVPYEMQDTVAADLAAAVTATTGPTGGSENVMCLSCHRAHASGFDSGTRFKLDTFLTDDAGNWGYKNASYEMGQDLSGYYSAAYYDRPSSQFGPSQRTLCNKCHGKDQ